ISMAAAAITGVPARVNKTLAPAQRQILQSAEILIITGCFPGQEAMQGMVKVVVPLGIQTEAARFPGSNDTGIVERTFSDAIYAAI
ncbi:MAG: hypothetical protein P8X90_16035, partial [Desulfobacterales bacterium]